MRKERAADEGEKRRERVMRKEGKFRGDGQRVDLEGEGERESERM